MKLLSKELVSLEYCKQLQQDLARAKVFRFLVAYISLEGLESIGRHLLTLALRDPRSFGVASLSCSCGYEPLLKLQRDIPELRLKYFMDPIVNEPAEPDNLALFHSKLLYLTLERDNKAVIYIGSHNWTRRALGPPGPRNAEASIRFEVPLNAEDLDGSGPGLASQVNRHLLDAWQMPLCLPAQAANRPTFEEWYAKGCRRTISSPLQDTTIVLSVRRSTTPAPSANEWLQLEGRGIYLQALDEQDGQTVWRCNDRLLVLVWPSSAALQTADQPIILQCRVTTYNACPGCGMDSTNQSDNPVKGFQAVIFDATQLASMQGGSRAPRPPVRIWSGRDIHVFDFEFPTPWTESPQVDAGVLPKYRFYLEVERIVFSAGGKFPDHASLLWERESFAVAETKESAQFHDKPGFFVDAKLRDAMLASLRKPLLIRPDQAKVLPFSDYDRSKAGRRVSRHPLHDTYIGKELRLQRDEFYTKTQLGALVADIDDPAKDKNHQAEVISVQDPLPRAQKVFTMPFQDLFEIWEETAKHHTRKHPPK
jgi:hypothetical protein